MTFHLGICSTLWGVSLCIICVIGDAELKAPKWDFFILKMLHFTLSSVIWYVLYYCMKCVLVCGSKMTIYSLQRRKPRQTAS